MQNFKRMFSLVILAGIALFLNCTTEPDNTAISSDGVEIRFDVQGEGEPALVFVHGWSRNRTDWKKHMDDFSDKHKVIAVDLAGFGESGNNRENWTMEAFGNDVVSVIEHLDLSKVILIGHSMGTPVIMKAAQQIPEIVTGLVPVDMLHDVDQTKSEDEIEQMVDVYMDLIINISEEKIRSQFVKTVDNDLVSEFLDYYTSSSKVGWEESIRSTFKWMSDMQPEDLKNIKAPICCINSDQRIPNVDLVKQYSQKFDAKIINGIGHWVMWEAPDEFNSVLEETIQEFLDFSK